MTISYVFLSTFSDLIFSITTGFAKQQESHPVGCIFYLFQLLQVWALHWEYCSALALGQDVY